MIEKIAANTDCLNCEHFYLHYIKNNERLVLAECMWGHCRYKKQIIDLRIRPSNKCKHKVVHDAASEQSKIQQTTYSLLKDMSVRLQRLVDYYKKAEEVDISAEYP